MEVPVYKNRVGLQTQRAAGGRVEGPRPEQFENGARSVAQLGQGLMQAGEAFANAEKTLNIGFQRAEERQAQRHAVQRQTDIMRGFERENNELLNGKLDEQGNTLEEGLLQKQMSNAKGVAETYRQKGQEILDKYLAQAGTPTERAYLEQVLGRGFDKRYNTVISYEIGEDRKTTNAAAKAFFDTAANEAGAIVDPADMRTHLKAQYAMSDTTAQSNGLSKEEQKAARYELANLNMTSSVHGALWKGNIPVARRMLDTMKKDMLADDWNRLDFQVKNAQLAFEKAQKSGEPKATEVLYQRAIETMDKDPEAFQREVKKAGGNILQFQKNFMNATGLFVSAKDIVTYLDWAQKTLDAPEGTIGQQKRANFASSKTVFDAFDIDKDTYDVQNEEMRSAGALADEITHLNNQILDGAFTDADAKKAQENLDMMRRALGTQITQNTPHPWFNQTGDEYVQKQIAQFYEGEEVDGILLEDVAGMYETLRQRALKENVDLSQPYSEIKQDVDLALSYARKQFVAAKYGIPTTVVDAAIYNGKLMELSGEPEAKRESYMRDLATKAQEYKAGIWDGRKARVKKVGGEIVDIYFED